MIENEDFRVTFGVHREELSRCRSLEAKPKQTFGNIQCGGVGFGVSVVGISGFF